MKPILGLLLVGTLLVSQEDADIRKQIALISDQDPRAAFEAISRLSDLAVSKRDAVGKAVDALPDSLAFYRDMAHEELRVRDALGERYPALTRFSFSWTDKAVPEAVAELNEAAGSRGPWLLLNQDLKRTVTASLEDATLMQGLDAFLRNVDMHGLTPGRPINVWPGLINGADRQPYRNFLTDLWSVRIERSVEFGGAARHEFKILFMLWWEPGIEVVRVRPAEQVELFDDKKRAITPLALEPAQPDHVLNGAVAHLGHHSQLRLSLPAADAAALSRFRGFIPISLSTAEEKMDLGKALEKGKRVEGNLAVVELSKESFEGQTIAVRVTPKIAKSVFAETPVQFRVKLKDGSEGIVTNGGVLADEAVSYNLIIYGRTGPRVPKVADIESLVLVLYPKTFERKVYFDFRDIPLK